jgi:hypothetical protein
MVRSIGITHRCGTRTKFFCPVCNFIYEDEIVGLVLRPARKENGQYQHVGSLHVHKGLGFTLFKSYKNPKLNEFLFKDFDETKGYMIESCVSKQRKSLMTVQNLGDFPKKETIRESTRLP